MSLRRGELIDIDIDSAGFEGVAVGRYEGLVVFVANAVPGDRVRARIRRTRKKHAEAAVEELLAPSPLRVDPPCRYFEICGGCSWQNLDYPEQLRSKQAQVADLFQRMGGFEHCRVSPVLESPEPYHYRNKMEFTFGSSRWLTREEIASGLEVRRDFALGLHIPKRFDKILDLDVCYLQSPSSVQIVNRVRQIALAEGWSCYDVRSHSGYLRNLVIRLGKKTGDLMVNLVTDSSQPERLELLTGHLLEAVPEITTIVNTVHAGRSPVPSNEQEIVYRGPGWIEERIGSCTFQIRPSTFFQPNTLQAERLYAVVSRLAGLEGGESVWDLYCGIGSISLFLAGRAGSLLGVENQPEAVEDARRNAERNQVTNARFVTADVEAIRGPEFAARHGRPDLVIVDPPRVGMHEKVCRALLQLYPRRIIYVSCNPATQVRDLKILAERYRIGTIQPVDMFPQTYHIENVVSLEAPAPTS